MRPPLRSRFIDLRAEVARTEAAREAAEAARGVAQGQLNAARLTAADVAQLAALAVPMLSDDCPVCGQRIDREHVERELRERAEATGTLLELQETFVVLANEFSRTAGAATTARQVLADSRAAG